MGWELGWNQRACRLPQVISKTHISFAVDTLHFNCCDFIPPHLLTPKKGFSRGIPSKWPECSSVNYHCLEFHLHESERTGFGSHPQKSITGSRPWNLIHWCVVASSTSRREACASIAPTYVPPISECNSQILCGVPGYQILLLGKDDGHAQAWMRFFFEVLPCLAHSGLYNCQPVILHGIHPSLASFNFFGLLGWYDFGSPITTWFEHR